MSSVEYRIYPECDAYRVGSDGTIWSRRNARWGYRDEWRLLKGSEDSLGYIHHGLMIPPKKTGTGKMAHVMVLESFVGPRPEGFDACHCNGNARDNRLENLRWDSRAGNVADMKIHGTALKGENVSGSRLTKEQVIEIRGIHARGEMGYKRLMKKYGVSFSCIVCVVRRKSWDHVEPCEYEREKNRLIALKTAAQ